MNGKMKKLVALFLLTLHIAGSTAGFVAHAIAGYHSDRFFERQTSRGRYYKNDLTEIKIPVNMPGIADLGYQDVFGEVRFANSAYNYVKIRMTPNAVYLLCVPNYATTKLCGRNVIDAKNIPDKPVNKKEHVPFDKVFNHTVFNMCDISFRLFTPITHTVILSPFTNIGIKNSSIATPGEPPEAA
jgi:hypothetical protein